MVDVASFTNFANCGKKIIGAAMNYNALLKLTNAAMPKEPVMFLKPSTSYITEGKSIILPKAFAVNEEIELGVIIGKTCKNICEENAMDYVGGYCVALDMTATCQMKEARAKGLPWNIGKGFDTACPVSRFITKEEICNPHDVDLWCTVNGKERQCGNTSDLIFNVPKLVTFISKYMTLEPNDLILTGSPPGMGPVYPGDCIEGGILNLVTIKFNVE